MRKESVVVNCIASVRILGEGGQDEWQKLIWQEQPPRFRVSIRLKAKPRVRPKDRDGDRLGIRPRVSARYQRPCGGAGLTQESRSNSEPNLQVRAAAASNLHYCLGT